MPRFLYGYSKKYISAPSGIVPIVLGGTSGTNAVDAAKNLGLIRAIMINQPNGVAGLGPDARLDGSVMPTGLGIAIDGPTAVYPSQVATYKIVNYSPFFIYTISAIGGIVTRTGDTMQFLTTGQSGSMASIRINGQVFSILITGSGIVTPVITSPTDNKVNVPLAPIFTCTPFKSIGQTQTQDNVRWEVSTTITFDAGTLVEVYEGTTNYSSWQCPSLNVNTIYYVRVKHHSSTTNWSAWSTPIKFTTIVSYGWIVRVGNMNPYDSQILGMTRDNEGNLYTVGYTNTDTASNNSVITKWNDAGSLIWTRTLIADYNDRLTAITCDELGNLFAVGYELSTSGGNAAYAMMSVWNKDGDLKYINSYHTIDNSYFTGIDIDVNGSLYAVGYNNSISGTVGIVAKLDATCQIKWQRKLGGVNDINNVLRAVKADGSGNIYTVGAEMSYANNNVMYDAVLSKWNADGDLIWHRRLGGNDQDIFNGLSVDIGGNICAVGAEMSTSGSNFNGLITKWNNAGDLLWQRRLGGSGDDQFHQVVTDVHGELYVVGKATYTSLGTDALVSKWDLSGNVVWQRRIYTNKNDAFTCVVYDSLNNLYIGGYGTFDNDMEFPVVMKCPTNVSAVNDANVTDTGTPTLHITTPTLSSAVTYLLESANITTHVDVLDLQTVAPDFTISNDAPILHFNNL